MITAKSPIEHFKELVATAIKHQRVSTNELAEFYLSNLLADFVAAKRFSRELSDEPLSMSYLKALGAGREEQGVILKRLGDFSLFISGFFSDSLKRKIIDIDFYILTGVSSYGHLAEFYRTGDTQALSQLFEELAGNFKAFVDVLAEVSERSSLTSASDVLRIYERWLRTKSKRAESLLRELGIEPQEISTEPLH